MLLHLILLVVGQFRVFSSYWYLTYSHCLLGGSEDAYTNSLGLVVRVSNKTWSCLFSPMLDSGHIDITKQATEGGLLKLHFKDLELILFLQFGVFFGVSLAVLS